MYDCILSNLITYRMKLSKIPLLHVYSKATFSMRTKTHYDVLEISPSATQSEIKSAYYQLSLIYHPDKNESEIARKKFQEISDAYEVLSNHHTRKQYDMRAMVNQTRSQSAEAQFRNAKVNYESNVKYPTAGKAYDFDQWTRQHYQAAFQATLRRRRIYEDIVSRRNVETSNTTPLYIIICVITVCGIIWHNLHFNYIIDNDVVGEKNKETKSNK